MNWMKSNKNILKGLSNELAYIGIPITSAASMGIYVSQFLEKNFPNLPEQTIEKIAHFINNNPQILELLK